MNATAKLHADFLYLCSKAERDVMRCKGREGDPVVAMNIWSAANERATVYKDLALRLERENPALAPVGRAWREKVARERADAAQEVAG